MITLNVLVPSAPFKAVITASYVSPVSVRTSEAALSLLGCYKQLV